jgi:DNA mismatch repair protein MutS
MEESAVASETTPSPETSSRKTAARDPRDTPAMRQYRTFKESHPDCILFFRMGDFYEMFDDDAVEISRALGLTLTERTSGIPMAGVPFHAAETYLQRMIGQGYRVAVCDQIQDPKDAKGVVDRAVTRVITPGTLVDAVLLDDASSNTLVAIVASQDNGRSMAHLAIAELSTGRFDIRSVPVEQAVDVLVRVGVSELLCADEDRLDPIITRLVEALGCSLSTAAGWAFRHTDAHRLITDHFTVASTAGWGIDDDDPILTAAGGLLHYLTLTQGRDGGGLTHLQPPRPRNSDDSMMIDATTHRSLELEQTMRSGSVEGSLLWVMQRCRTPMGKRLLREWLCFPLRDIDGITARGDCVEAMLASPPLLRGISDAIGPVQDVARIVGRLATGRVTPRDVVALGRSLNITDSLAHAIEQDASLSPWGDRLAALTATLTPLATSILQQCIDDPPGHLRDGGLFRDGFDTALDEAKGLQRDAGAWLASYQEELIESTGIPPLKVGFNKVFGYYIEVTHAQTSKVPMTFVRKQTLKNAERYITPELKTFEDRVLSADAQAIEREQLLFEQLCTSLQQSSEALSDFAAVIAEIDVLTCFSDVARDENWTRPVMTTTPTLQIKDGRHPVLDRLLGDQFVPNDCVLTASGDDGTFALVTGPNMAGKSTWIRQVALITLLAHTGSFVPASSATIGLTDRIFTRIGASDELHAGRSTFMVEMIETAAILNSATVNSLVILDEIGRGTSTLDGLSLAWAIAETLAARGCRTLFATHYHELTSLAQRLQGVTNLHVAVREWDDQIIFLYRILPGQSDRSYGIHVAQLAGVPGETIDRARELLQTLTVQTETTAGRSSDAGDGGQFDLFTEYLQHPAIERLRGINLEAMTPMEAFDLLRTLAEGVQQSPPPTTS